MNSVVGCSPASLDSTEDCVNDQLLNNYSDTVEEALPADTDIVNGDVPVDGEAKKLADSDSDDGCDDMADGNPVHGLITHCQQANSTALDLSRRGLKSFCHKLQKLPQLQVNR